MGKRDAILSHQSTVTKFFMEVKKVFKIFGRLRKNVNFCDFISSDIGTLLEYIRNETRGILYPLAE